MPPRRRFLLEPLEGRFLLSADTPLIPLVAFADPALEAAALSASLAPEVPGGHGALTSAAPVVETPAPVVLDEGGLFGFTPVAQDPDGDALLFQLGEDAPAAATIDPRTGRIDWQTTEDDGGRVHQFTLLVTDTGIPSPATVQLLEVTVNETNRAPVLTGIGEKRATTGQALSFLLPGADPDRGPAGERDPLTFSLVDAEVAGADVDPATGRFTWTASEPPGRYTFTAQISDGELTATRSFVVAVTPPATGTEADDVIVVTEAADAITVTINGVSETFGPELPRVEVFGLGGNDTITLIGLSRAATVDAGTGDDVVDGSQVQAAPLTLRGGAGADQLTGGAGADVLAGGAGADGITGGAGTDIITWRAGDGQDAVDSGPGLDTLTVIGDGTAETFTLRGAGGHLLIERGAPPSEGVDGVGLERVTLNAGAGEDSITVLDLGGTGLMALAIGAGAGADTVDASLSGLGASIRGETGNDQLRGGSAGDTFTWQSGDGEDVVEGGAGSDRVSILGTGAADVFELSAAAGHLTIDQADRPPSGVDAVEVEEVQLLTRGGGDAVTVHDLTGTGVELLTIEAGAGDDRVDASSLSALGVTLLGGPGNDIVLGGQGADDIDGGGGSDLLVGNGGADGLTDGAGNDVILGGPGADVLSDLVGDNLLLEGATPSTPLSPRDQALVDWATGHPDIDQLSLNPRTRRWALDFVGAVTPTPAVSTPDLLAASDTGASDTDDVTVDATPTVQVTADAGALVRLFVDGSEAAQGVAVGGVAEFTLSSLTDGSHDLTATAEDTASNVSAPSAALAVLIDTVAPATPAFDLAPGSDTAPTGDQQTTLATVTLEGDTDPGVVVMLLETAATTTADGTGAFAIAGVALALGPNSFTARATDPAGNASEFTRTITRLEPSGEDVTPPVITAAVANDTGADAGDGVTQDPTVQGTVVDEGAIAAFRAGLDGAAVADFVDVLASLGADGSFTLDAATLAVMNGGPLADGAHTLHLVATDGVDNTSAVFDIAFTLDTAAPILVVDSPADGATVLPGAELSGTADGTGSAVASVVYTLGGLVPIAVGVGSDGGFAQPLAVDTLAEGQHALVVEVTDAAGNTATASLDVLLEVPFTVAAHAPLDGMDEVGVTARPRLDFSKAIDPATLGETALFAKVGDATLPATIVVSNDGRLAWLYATGGLPGGAQVEVTVDGDLIKSLDGAALDADGDGTPGGMLRFTFATVGTVALPGTTLSGRVLDVGSDFLPLTADDVQPGADGEVGTDDDVFLRPVAGVPVFLLGLEEHGVLTGADGRFHFDAVPAGDVKVVIDGQEVAGPPGVAFPEVILDTATKPATANDLGAIYLPRLGDDVYAGVDADEETVLTLAPGGAFGLTEEQRQQFTLEIAPDSLLSADGQHVASGEVGLGVVPLDVLAGLLPTGLPAPLMAFTIQTNGFTDFAQPVQLTLPNLSGAAPGTTFQLLTFDHTTRQLVNDGTLVVSSAPAAPLVTTLGGSGVSVAASPIEELIQTFFRGITFACFHLVVANTSPGGPPCPPEADHPVDVDPIVDFSGLKSQLFLNDDGVVHLSFSNDAQPIEPTADPCADPNRQATPLEVRIEVDGPAGAFLDGLESQTIELFPQESVELDVEVRDFAPILKTFTADQLYAAHVHVTAFQSSAPDALLFDERFSLARYVAVVDPAGKDAVFLKTLADGPDGFERTKQVDYHLPSEVATRTTGVGRFDLDLGDLFGEAATTWFFDPISAGGAGHTQQQSTQVVITIGGDALPQQLTARGTAIEPTFVGPNRSEFEKAIEFYLDDQTHFDGTPGVPQASAKFIEVFGAGVPFLQGGPLTPERLAERAEFIHLAGQRLVEAVAADFAPVNGGLPAFNVVESGGQLSVVWQSVVPGERGFVFGVADSQDADRDRLAQVLPTTVNLPDVAKEWVFAEELNDRVVGTVTLGFATHAEQWVATGGTTFTEFVAQTVSHELAHTFGVGEAYLDAHGMVVDLPPWDVMRSGSPGPLGFADVNALTLGAAMGIAPQTPGALAGAIAMFKKNFNLKDNTVGLPRENTSPPAAVGALGVSVGDDDLFTGDTLAAATVLVDGAGGAAATFTLTLTNVGLAPMTIGALDFVDGDAGFSLVGPSPTGTPLDIGASVAVGLVFDPSAEGTATDSLTIASDAPGEPFTLLLSGDGLTTNGRITATLARASFTGEPVQNNVGGLALDAVPRTVEGMLTVGNSGDGALTITAVNVIGDAAAQFAVGGLPAGFGPGNPLVLARGETIALDVTFDAAALGLQRAQIEIVSDDPATPALRQTVVGTGLADEGSALEYGHDFVAVEVADSPVTRTVSDAGGNWTFYLASGRRFHNAIFDPVSGLIAHGFGVTAPAGIETDILTPVFGASTAPDRDGDGLPDDVEFAVGTGVASVDSDGDGVDDFAELRAGLDPLDDEAPSTGVVGGLALDGEAWDIAVAGELAYVAIGDGGLAIVDISDVRDPLLVGQRDLAGFQTSVAVDASRGLAALASNFVEPGVQIVDVSDPASPQQLRSVSLAAGASHVEVLDGVAFVASGTAVVAIELVSGDVLQTLDLGGAVLSGLAREAQTLLAMDGDGALTAIDIGGSEMIERDTLAVADGGGEIFVGGGVAYLAAEGGGRGGFATVDVSDPGDLALISGSDVPSGFRPEQAVAADGSGRVLVVGDVPDPDNLFLTLDVVDVADATDPADTDAYLARFLLPEFPLGVATASGHGLIADGEGGLLVVSYHAPDTGGEAPTVSISAIAEDADPGTPGVQVLPGSTIHVLVDAADDTFVEGVELLVNGLVVETDPSFPYEALLVADGAAGSLSVQARATDGAGNDALSNALVFSVVGDTEAPTIVERDPVDGAILPEGLQDVRVRFSEALAPATVTTGTFRLLDGAGQPVVAEGISLLSEGRRVELSFTGLSADTYELVIDGPAVTDLAGNELAAGPVVSSFTLTGDVVEWINPAGGFWDDPANWEGGVLPGPGDNVLIDVPGDITVFHRTGTTVISRLVSRESVTVTGGILDVATTIQVDGALTFDGDATLRHATLLPGAGPQPAAGGFITFDDVTVGADIGIANLGTLQVTNGLTLDEARVTLQNAGLFFTGTQVLGGSGEVFFGGLDDADNRVSANGGLLTIGENILVHGDRRGRLEAFTDGIRVEGTILADGAGHAITVDGEWTNAGRLVGGAGRLELHGLFTIEGRGIFDATKGPVVLVGTLNNAGKTLTLDDITGSLTGAGGRILGGRVEISGGATLDPQATVTLDGVTLGGDLVLHSLQEVVIENGLTLDGATVQLVDDTDFFFGAELRFNGTQTLGGTGQILFTGSGDDSDLTVTSAETATLGPGITVTGDAPGATLFGRLVNQGVIAFETAGQFIDLFSPAFVNQGTLRALNGARFTIQTLTNGGTVTVGAGSRIAPTLSSLTVVQTSGLIDLQGGIIDVGTVDLQGGVLAGFGTIDANVVNAGRVAPGTASGDQTGLLTINGNFTQAATGVLAVQLGGTATDDFDRLIVNLASSAIATATFGGTLEVSLTGGFTPALGNTFDIITFEASSGAFAQTTGLDLGSGLELQAVLESTRLRLTAVTA